MQKTKTQENHRTCSLVAAYCCCCVSVHWSASTNVLYSGYSGPRLAHSPPARPRLAHSRLRDSLADPSYGSRLTAHSLRPFHHRSFAPLGRSERPLLITRIHVRLVRDLAVARRPPRVGRVLRVPAEFRLRILGHGARRAVGDEELPRRLRLRHPHRACRGAAALFPVSRGGGRHRRRRRVHCIRGLGVLRVLRVEGLVLGCPLRGGLGGHGRRGRRAIARVAGRGRRSPDRLVVVSIVVLALCGLNAGSGVVVVVRGVEGGPVGAVLAVAV